MQGAPHTDPTSLTSVDTRGLQPLGLQIQVIPADIIPIGHAGGA